MGTRRTAPSFLKRFERLERQARLERIRRKGHTESKTFIVGSDITTALFVPPLFVGIDHDGETPEWKRLTGFAAVLGTGTCTLEWLLNGVAVPLPGSTTSMAVSTTPAYVDLTGGLEIDLAHADTLQPTVTAASTATDLSASAFIVTAVR